jgi:pimeloyl-ACP methyl ester carboxylesterase
VSPTRGSDRSGRLWPYPEVGRYTQAGGVRWHHLRLGTGPSLLLLHGSASSTHAWAEVASRVRSHFSVFIPDLPGHGHSTGLPSDVGGLDDLARALGALLRAEGVDPVLVAGHSAGAVLAIRAAARGWIAPRGLLGVNPALGSRDTFLPPVLAGPLVSLARSRAPARMGAVLFRTVPLAEVLLGTTGSRVSPETRLRYRRLLADPATGGRRPPPHGGLGSHGGGGRSRRPGHPRPLPHREPGPLGAAGPGPGPCRGYPGGGAAGPGPSPPGGGPGGGGPGAPGDGPCRGDPGGGRREG